MEYSIYSGIPEVKEFWDNLKSKVTSKNTNKDEEKLYKQFGKAMYLLSRNPRHPSLKSHEVATLSARYGIKVWESYQENNTSAATRIFWSYGPKQGQITIVGIEPHSDSYTYTKITLSKMGEEIK